MSLPQPASDKRTDSKQVCEQKSNLRNSPVLGGYWKLVEHQIKQIRKVAVCTAQKSKCNDFAQVVTALTQMLDTFTSWEEANSELDKIYEQLSRYDYETQQKVLRRKERFKVAKTVVDKQFEKVRSGLELDAHCSSSKEGTQSPSSYSGSEIEKDLAHLHGMMHEIALLAESIGSAQKEGMLIGDIQHLSKYVRMARAMRADATKGDQNQPLPANTKQNYNAILDVIKNGEHQNNASNNKCVDQDAEVKEEVIVPKTHLPVMAIDQRATMHVGRSVTETDGERMPIVNLHDTHSWWQWIGKKIILLAKTVGKLADDDEDDQCDYEWTDDYLYETATDKYSAVKNVEVNNCNNQAWMTSSTSYARQEIQDLASDSDLNQSHRVRMNLQDQAQQQSAACERAQRSVLDHSQSMPNPPRTQDVDQDQIDAYMEHCAQYYNGKYKSTSLGANARYQPKSRSKGITFSREMPQRDVTADLCADTHTYIQDQNRDHYRESVDSMAGRLTHDLRGPSFSAPSTPRMGDIDENELMLNGPQLYNDDACRPKSSSLGARPKQQVTSQSQRIAMFARTSRPHIDESPSYAQQMTNVEPSRPSLDKSMIEPPHADTSAIYPSPSDDNAIVPAYSTEAPVHDTSTEASAQPHISTIEPPQPDTGTTAPEQTYTSTIAPKQPDTSPTAPALIETNTVAPSWADPRFSMQSSYADELLTAIESQVSDLPKTPTGMANDDDQTQLAPVALTTEDHRFETAVKPDLVDSIAPVMVTNQDDDQLAPSTAAPSPVASSRISDDRRKLAPLPPVVRRRRRRRTHAWCRCSLLNGLVHAYILMGFVLLVLTIRHNILTFWPMCGVDQITLRHYGVPVF